MELVSILRVVHIIAAILMAWPFYALVAVNQRARLGPPLGDRVDVYLENVVKNRVVPCYIFQLTALVTGVWLMFAAGLGLDALVTSWVLGAKFVLLLVIIAAEPVALPLRYLQTLTEMAGEHNSTVIPFPIDSVGTVVDALRRRNASNA